MVRSHRSPRVSFGCGSAQSVRRLFVGILAALTLAFSFTTQVAGAQAAPDPPIEPRIVGGNASDPGEFPFLVALVNSGQGNTRIGQFCGGTVIDANTILTAAHCIDSGPPPATIAPASVNVVTGRHNLNCFDFGGTPVCTEGQRLDVTAITIHPQFNPATFENDIALLTLASPTTAPPITWARPSDAASFTPGTVATVMGWGQTESVPAFPDVPYDVNVALLSDAGCETPNTTYPTAWIVDDIMICAGDVLNGGVDACVGDSGGPLVVPKAGGGWLQVGLVSFGVGCAEPLAPGVYTEIAAFRSFIEPLANISVTTTDGVTSATPGGSTTYTTVVANAGPSTDPAVGITDAFPTSLTCSTTSIASGGATGNATSATGNIADTVAMPSGSSVIYTSVCAIDAGSTGTLTNTVTAPSSTADPNLADNTATDDDTFLIPLADISVSNVVSTSAQFSPGPANLPASGSLILVPAAVAPITVPGSSIVNYSITVTNPGPSNDPAVQFRDTLPAALSCAWTSTATGGATGSAGAGAGNLAEALSMPVGATVTYSVRCTIDPAATGTLTNTATATASDVDPNVTNNSASSNTLLVPTADISVTATDGVTTVRPGEGALIYTIVVRNAGPSTDPSVGVVDTFPAGFTCSWTAVSADGASSSPAAGSSHLNQTMSMPPGSSVTYTVRCSIPATAQGGVTNTATATPSVTDPVSANNSATDSDTVIVVPTGVLPATGSKHAGTLTGGLLSLIAGLVLLGASRRPPQRHRRPAH